MYCGICSNPLIMTGLKSIPRGSDTSDCMFQCSICHRIYYVELIVRKETDWTEEEQKNRSEIHR